jgi:hypothetical protein
MILRISTEPIFLFALLGALMFCIGTSINDRNSIKNSDTEESTGAIFYAL